MKFICLFLLSVLLIACLIRYGRWFLARIYTYLQLRNITKKANLKFTVHGSDWLFARNGDGKVSYTIETPDTVYFIHLCGSIPLRCSYIFKDETHWILRKYALLGRGQDYTESAISVQPIRIPEEVVTIAAEQIVYLFAPVPLGSGIVMPDGRVLPVGPGQEIPGGVLHNVDSFCASIVEGGGGE